MPKPGAVLGISESHCSTAALLLDGSLVACVSEERFTRNKNTAGFPHQAVAYVLKQAGLTASDLEAVVLSNESPTNHFFYGGAKEDDVQAGLLKRVAEGAMGSGWVDIRPLKRGVDAAAAALMFPRLRRKQVADIAGWLGVDPARIAFLDHHKAHAYSALYFLPQGALGRDACVLTLDGIGDRLSGTVSRLEGGKLKRLAVTDYFDSVGLLYAAFTQFLGMKANEHEYKVMGLAPYADPKLVKIGLQGMQRVLRQRGLGFEVGISLQHPLDELQRIFGHLRFDAVAGALQLATEEAMLSWAKNAMQAAGSRTVAASGGCFMNVKVNMRLREESGLDSLTLCPSAGDESNAIGAAYGWHLEQGRPEAEGRKRDLYLGPAFSRAEVEAAAAKPGWKGRYKAHPISDPSAEGARLLADGEVVSTLLGRMEFGARSLGNRSILAHPGKPGVVREINHAIKMRDFWMPFAGTLLKRRAGDYLQSRLPFDGPYMMTAYDSTPKARTEILNALHPFDYTMRPQLLEQGFNPVYYGILEGFEKKTGLGGILNTSFNLHGEPMVCGPEDAIHTLDESGLKWLLHDEVLIEKLA